MINIQPEKLNLFHYDVEAELNIGQNMIITQHDVDKIIFGNISSMMDLVKPNLADRSATINAHSTYVHIGHIDHMRLHIDTYKDACLIDMLIESLDVVWTNDSIYDKLDALEIYLLYGIGVTNTDIGVVKTIIQTIKHCDVVDPLDDVLHDFHEYGHYIRKIVGYYNGINY